MSSRSTGNKHENLVMGWFKGLGYKCFKPTHGSRWQKQVDIFADETRIGFDFLAQMPHEPWVAVQVKTGKTPQFEVLQSMAQWVVESRNSLGVELVRPCLALVVKEKRKKPSIIILSGENLLQEFLRRKEKREQLGY